MFTLLMASDYAIPDSLPVTLIVVLAISLQIAFDVFLVGGSGGLFFAKSAAIEIGSFLYGTFFYCVSDTVR